jgi:pyruvate/2-oxoacid:ferredoxin oxidoreductase beta subunit
VGLGLVIMSTARVWMSVLGSVAASSSALLIALDARGPYFNDSYYWVYAGDGIAIILGVAMTVVALRRRARAVAVARQD